jgi:hypothetical protein
LELGLSTKPTVAADPVVATKAVNMAGKRALSITTLLTKQIRARKPDP